MDTAASLDTVDQNSATIADSSATSVLFSSVYDNLKVLAHRQRARCGGARTLCTTELVHETYLRISKSNYRHQMPAQFFAYAARTMRHILTDAARRSMQTKRGGDQTRTELSDAIAAQVDSGLALQLDRALCELEREDPRAAQVVELHFFAGLDLHKVAEILGIARRTVDRDWRYARAALAAYTEI